MTTASFVRNAWYVAGWSRDFGREMRALRILGEDVVFYRREDGAPVALEDACPHRKLPLSKGRLIGDDVECGYHGLTFDCSGACVRAPTQEGHIPARAVVHSYPVADRWDLLWVWMGEPAAADPEAIIDIPHFDDPTWGRTPGGSMDVACNYLYVMDNLLDPSHVAWVHVTSFAGAGTESEPLRVDTLEDGVLVWRWLNDRPPPPYYANLVRFSGNCDRKQHYECRVPSIAINKSIFTPKGTGGSEGALPAEAFINVSYNFMTPVDEANTRYFWFQHRNTDPDNAEVSQRMFEGAKMAFEEDRLVLVHVQDGMARSRTPHFNLGIDAGAVRFRQMVDRRIAGERPAG
ncbi:MAG: Rieske 2Fe-2S domain-containing protein [Rhizobiales bacterium]|nr:Rieske 2Fe-2S domain-containing protein [Hyphomicrobiales bacterium]